MDGFNRLSTPVKLLLLFSIVLLPIGGLLMAIGSSAIDDAEETLARSADQQAAQVSGAIDGLIARNALGLRLAANGALRAGVTDPCGAVRATLAIAPAILHDFELEDSSGRPICAIGDFSDLDRPPLTAPGDIRLWIARDRNSLLIRTGVMGGSATTRLSLDEIREAARQGSRTVRSLAIRDDFLETQVLRAAAGAEIREAQLALADGQLDARVGVDRRPLTTIERLVLFLPLIMWALAAVLVWWLVQRFLMRPLRLLDRAVRNYHPETAAFAVPAGLGSASEIRGLAENFHVSVDRLEQSEREMKAALDGQRRLVREVHHRVKNNLQVVASLLSIHGRSAQTTEAKSAYLAIGRRVDALAVVHRNHYAELEENQGIALRPMLTELASGLRSSAPDASNPQALSLDLDHAATTQDAAVAAAFLITEVVEYAMLHGDGQEVEIQLRRLGPLSARLTLASPALLEDDGEVHAERRHFERIVDGLARQLRSPLDRNLGRYSVDLPVFPER